MFDLVPYLLVCKPRMPRAVPLRRDTTVVNDTAYVEAVMGVQLPVPRGQSCRILPGSR
jgi:hypothetical protein